MKIWYKGGWLSVKSRLQVEKHSFSDEIQLERTWSHVLEAMLFPSAFTGFKGKRVPQPNKFGKHHSPTKEKKCSEFLRTFSM